ncbi:hypothetical protein DPMN_087065 [Dreissena polymorpha]|uniref:Uncharacterized protein n=1 Tax=Dreissena polymorpha TaxID=45954 RepID=A0A9D4KSB2_DREPO|nr:hypothetical protein DPMN_087065 [Dreissena polymorpha]
MIKTLNFSVAPTQAMNKYFSLKDSGRKLLIVKQELKQNYSDTKISLINYMALKPAQNHRSSLIMESSCLEIFRLKHLPVQLDIILGDRKKGGREEKGNLWK